VGRRRPQGSQRRKAVVYTTVRKHLWNAETPLCRRLVGTGLAPVRLVATLAVALPTAHPRALKRLWAQDPSLRYHSHQHLRDEQKDEVKYQ
jgi:hypothetical protein